MLESLCNVCGMVRGDCECRAEANRVKESTQPMALAINVEFTFVGPRSYNAACVLEKRLKEKGITCRLTSYNTLGPNATNSVKVGILDLEEATKSADAILHVYNNPREGN